MGTIRQVKPIVDSDERIAQRVANIVLTRIAAALAPEPTWYSTRRGQAPPGWTDEGWRTITESVPGTYRPAGADGKPGRWLVTPRGAFDAWVSARSTAAPAPSPPANDSEPWSPAQSMREIGLRGSQ